MLLKIYLHLNSEERLLCFWGKNGRKKRTPRSGAVVPDRNYHRCRARFAHGRTGRPHNLHNLHNCTPSAHLGSRINCKVRGMCGPCDISRSLKVPPRPLFSAPPLGLASKSSCNYCVAALHMHCKLDIWLDSVSCNHKEIKICICHLEVLPSDINPCCPLTLKSKHPI